jgi:GNAT superfamily N-acetyltransferase
VPESPPVVEARRAAAEDLGELVRLYRLLEEEMVALKAIWSLTAGLAEPVGDGLAAALDDPGAGLYVGTIDSVPVGFLLGRSEPMLPQAGGERIAAVRLIFTQSEAREVGVGEAMMELFLDDHRDTHRYFDAHVSPGHRLAKNFFESNGFKARHIVMQHDSRA